MGINFEWQVGASPGDIIDDILRHIDGNLIENPINGLLQLNLSRKDFDVNDLLVLNESNCTVTSFSRTAVNSTINEVVATYTNAGKRFTAEPITVKDVGNMFAQDNHAPEELDLTMFHDADVAANRASAHWHQTNSTLARGTLNADRVAWKLYEGAPFVLDQSSMGEAGLVCRVLQIKKGGFENRAIVIEFIEDVFEVGSAIYSVAGASTWSDVTADPVAVAQSRLEEIPYPLLDADGAHQLLALAQRPISAAYEMGVMTSTNSTHYSRSNNGADFAEYGTLQTALAYNTSAIHAGSIVIDTILPAKISASVDAIKTDFENWFLIGDEWVAVETVSYPGDGTTVLSDIHRGMLDTVPVDHSIGADVWLLTGADTINRVFDTSSQAYAKLLPVTSKGGLGEGSTAAVNYTITNRALKPFPPGSIRVNNIYNGPATAYSGDSTVEWDRRSRTDLVIRGQGSTNDASEAGDEITLRIRDSSNGILRTEANATSPYVYTEAQELIDGGALSAVLKFELWSVNGVLQSQFTQSRTTKKTTS